MSGWDVEVTFAEFMDGCPVCGDPSGNCKGDSTFSGSVLFEDTPRRNNPAATFIVPRRVYEPQTVGRRVVKKLKYQKGARITLEEARLAGLLPPSHESVRPESAEESE